MSVTYKAVLWNRQKKVYDRALAAGVLLSITSFIGCGALLFPHVTAETLIIRAVGTVAFVLLHLILCIGPLCRLDNRFLPLLYNRRHMGVCMFVLALVHGGFSIIQFHAFGNLNPLVSVFVSNPEIAGVISQFPFQPFGLGALIILMVMAATSHDFWLANLTAPIWKAIHMGVYAAYALLVAHVSFGILQSETSSLYPILLGIGFTTVFGLHIAAAFREAPADARSDLRSNSRSEKDFVDVCAIDDIEEKKARIFSIGGERVAVFRYDGRISAISNVCQHQNGPLGEGEIIDGCVTCPWHGYQYDPATGQSPAPFTERIPTFDVRLDGRRILISRIPNPPGTAVAPAVFQDGSTSGGRH